MSENTNLAQKPEFTVVLSNISSYAALDHEFHDDTDTDAFIKAPVVPPVRSLDDVESESDLEPCVNMVLEEKFLDPKDGEAGFSDLELAEADKIWALPADIKKGMFGYSEMPMDQFLALLEAVAATSTDRFGNHSDSADVYVQAMDGLFRTNNDERLWIFTGRNWRVVKKVEASSCTAKQIKYSGGTLKDLNKAENVNELLAALADCLPPQAPGINVHNGFLTQQKGGRWKLEKHDPEDGQLYCLPFNYDPKAKCDRWLSFLRDVQPDTAVRRYLQDMVGYILLGSARPRAEMFFVLQGTGANGKSVFLETIKALVGKENFSTLAMHQFTGRNLESLVGKIANFGSETERTESMETSVFKQAVSGEPVQAEPKYRDHYSFVSRAALVFAINEMPSVDERTDGIWRRMKLVLWPVTIADDKKDLSLIDKLKEELPGILRWALGGASRVARKGKLMEPKSVAAAVRQVRVENNNIAAFLMECAKVGDGARISKQDAYTAYARWAKAGGFKAASKTNFGREVSRILKLNGSVKVPARYIDINGVPISSRPDAYPFCIPDDLIPAFEGVNVTGYRAVGTRMG